MQSNRPERLTLIAFIVSTILGSNNAIAVRMSNVELAPFFGAAARFTTSSLVLFLIVIAMRLPLPKGRSLVGALIYGALQFGISYALIYWSLTRVSAGLFQVIFALTPLFTFCFAILHHQESFQWRILAGGLIAVIGIAVIFSGQITVDISLPYFLAIILAAACIAESGVLFKTLPKGHPITTNAFAMGMGGVILFVFSWFFQETPQWPVLPATWIAILYLVFLGSIVTFILILYVLTRWTASATSYQLVLLPILTTLFASWLADERVTIPFLAGGLLVLAGVYFGALAPPDLFRRIFSRRRGISVGE